MKLKSGKAVRPDSIPAEALKADAETTVELLHPLFKKIWEEEQVPTEWKEGYLIKIPKKGNLSSCSNYRGISLLSIPGKVFKRILLERMKDVVDPHLSDQQAGFRKHRSCTDQIATLRIILEQSLEWNSSLYVNFIDFEKAFDSVDRASLWRLLRHYGVRRKSLTSSGTLTRDWLVEWSTAVNSQTPSWYKQECGKVVCCHHFCSCWPSIGSWKRPQ